MADITTKYKSKFTGAEIDAKLSQQTNPNLLDNGYFGNPVNQRGITTSANNAYGIDRWRTFSGTHTVGDGYVEISQNGIMSQYMENPSRLNGKEINFSVLTADRDLFTGFATATNLGSVYFFQDPDMGAYRTSAGLIQFYPKTKAIKIIAVKLELGTQQTLAHRDASGKWVLNEIPDYNEQLLRCCMSTADSSDTYANNKLTAAAVNAVPLDGSKAMTGALNIRPANTAVGVTIDPNASALTASLLRFNNNGNVWGMLGFKSANAPMLRTADGTKDYNILHTGNMPKVSYTGNGSATPRTIDTGGLESCCMLYCTQGIAFIGYWGGVGFEIETQTIYYIPQAEATFRSGVLNLATTNSIINGNSRTIYCKVI